MESVKTARGIIEIIHQNKKCIVSIKRTKFKDKNVIKEYYTLPGGHVEDKERFEEALIREVKEEIDIDIKIEKLFAHIYNKDLDRDEKFFICNYKNGKIKKGNGPEWENTDYEKYGKYEIVYLEVEKLKEYNLLPLEVKEMLIKRYTNE